METLRWTVGLSVALVCGGIVNQYWARKLKKLIGDEDPQYRILIPLSLGVVESLFFTIGVAFDLSGVMIGMVAWMGAKMAAHWGIESKEHQVKNIGTIRFSAWRNDDIATVRHDWRIDMFWQAMVLIY